MIKRIKCVSIALAVCLSGYAGANEDASLHSYTGIFETVDGKNTYILTDGIALYHIDGSGDPEMLVPLQSDLFSFANEKNRSLVFLRDPEGVVIGHDSDGEIAERRIVLNYSNKDKKKADINPKIYQKYVGEYSFPYNFKMIISVKDDHMYFKATGYPQLVEIFPSSETKYFCLDNDTTFTFLKKDDQVVGMEIVFQGQKYKGSKSK